LSALTRPPRRTRHPMDTRELPESGTGYRLTAFVGVAVVAHPRR
jgi:hypothetical protein